MKCIRQSDLEKLLPYIKNVETWDIDDFKRLLDKYGDDWFAEGNEFHLVTENENMKAFREQWKTYHPEDHTENILLIRTNTLLKGKISKQLHDNLVEQLKSGVVIIPPCFDAEILNVPENVKVVVQSKDDEHLK